MDEGIMKLDVLERIFDGSHEPTGLKLSALQSITRNFSEERIIGTGGFGTVYKGVLPNGEVAVKRIKNNHTIDEKLYRQEVNSLLQVNHKNIVRFLGFCSHTEHIVFEKGSRDYIYVEDRERILCFEYINNGSLENYITDELRGLQWDTRYSIIKGLCEGLQYLHVEKGIIHRDLKPANILIDNNMTAKITDFGLARMEENAQTKSTIGASTPGYTAPEYIDRREMSVKYDVYSLGIIIIELVTGSRRIPDSNKVLRRWRHRLHKLGKETTYRCQQIAKLIEIGLQCQEKEPYNRPFIAEIISDIEALDNTSRKISNENEPTVGQISPYSEDDMLGIEPLELRFPFELNSQISCSLELTNMTNSFIAFSVQTTSPLLYCIKPNKDIVAPRSKYSVNITLQPLDKAPKDKDAGSFIVRSTKVKESLINEGITENIFSREDSKLVDEVNLTITFKGQIPKVEVSFGSLTNSDMTNLHGTEESNVPSTEAESEISASTSHEVILFDPPSLYFPIVPDKKVLSSVKIINNTESYVSFVVCPPTIRPVTYSLGKYESIMPPRSTQWLSVTREGEDAIETPIDPNLWYHYRRRPVIDKNFLVRYDIVADDIKASDLDLNDYYGRRKLDVVLTNVNSCTSNELIQFDPPELSFPCPNKTSFSSVNIVNITDCYIGLNTWYFKNGASYGGEPFRAILSPRSSQRMVIRRTPKENGAEDMECRDKLYVWNMIVAEGVQASNLNGYTCYNNSKEVPLIFKKISPCTSDELIRLDHPGLHFTFSQNEIALSSFNMVNVTDCCVGFRLFDSDINGLRYIARPESGVLAPRSAQRVLVARLIKEKEPEDTQCNDDKLFMWNALVSEGIKVSDFNTSRMSMKREQSKELPVLLNKITSSPSVELIKFDPPEVRFPFLPRNSQLSSFKIVNITEYHIGYNTCAEETNMASYITDPPCGILPPGSTQQVLVTRVAKEDAPELEDMQCKDKYFLWSCFVTGDVNVSDIEEWMPITERKVLPIVFTETSLNEMIRFDPPELCLPMLANQSVLSSIKIANITDQYISFRICAKRSNSARYNANPSEGILSPLSTQVLLITRIGDEKELEDSQCNDKFLVWSGIVTEDVKASEVIDNMHETKCTQLPIVLTKTSSSISEELIQFDPPELHFPFLPNKKVSTSVNIVNLTDYNVGFNTHSRPKNVTYHTEPPRGILPPRSTQTLMVTREEKEDALTNTQFNGKYFVWKSIVSEGVKDSDLSGYLSDQESKEVPIVLDKISSSISDDLIQLDPAELCIPFLLNKTMLLVVNVVNITNFYVAFNAYYIKRAAAQYKSTVGNGILPPRSTEKLTIIWETTEREFDDMERDYFVWNRVVTECVESKDIIGYMGEEESKRLPVILSKVNTGIMSSKKTNPCISSGLIRFDPPELSLPFMPNKPLMFSVKIVNNTDYCVGIDIHKTETNLGRYSIQYDRSYIVQRSTERIAVKMVPHERKQEDMHCQDKFILWSSLEGNRIYYAEELPIVYKTILCTSNELIQFDPPQLPITFLPNKWARGMLHKFKIVNVTDHSVGFSILNGYYSDNYATYSTKPTSGILPPQSTQKIKVRRTQKLDTTEDMECNTKIFVWNGIVTEGVGENDVNYSDEESKELPFVLTKPLGSSWK